MSKVKLYTVAHKIYVGYTSQEIFKYWKKHIINSKKNSSRYFYRALKKYGSDSFNWTVIKEFETILEAKLAEINLIKYYKDNNMVLYNMTDGGDGHLGYKIPDHVRKKISNAHKGKKASSETKIKLSTSHKGLSSGNKGKKASLETRKKQSRSKIGKISPNKGKYKLSNEILFEIIHSYELGSSYRNIAKIYNVSTQTICNIIKRNKI